MKTRTGRNLTLAALLCAAFLGGSGAALAQEGPDSWADRTYPRYDPQYAQPSYHWGWLNGRDASGGSGWIDDITGQPMTLERGSSRMGPPGYHWGWFNGRDSTAGAGWINDRTGQPMARSQFRGRSQSMAGGDAYGRDGREMGPAGYHWGWLNGRDASGGQGWINDATGYPLEQGYGDSRREASRRYGY